MELAQLRAEVMRLREELERAQADRDRYRRALERLVDSPYIPRSFPLL